MGNCLFGMASTGGDIRRGARNFGFHECDQTFPTKKSLKDHLKSHTGKKLYEYVIFNWCSVEH
jgi:hypothetical protein